MMTWGKHAVPVLQQMDDSEIEDFWNHMHEHQQRRERKGRHVDALIVGAVVLAFVILIVFFPELPR